ncbi:MAG: response regulator [Kiritimatiellae bacterium]|nr:response regulator [Kiritimatiellia bacterium]
MKETDIPTVLIVDDEANIRFLLKMVIERAGMKLVGMAATGAAAITYYRRYKPDLVLMDIDMPMKSGLDALAELIDAHPEAKVIMMSAYVDEEVVKKCFKLGAVNFILKVTPIEQIQKIMQEVAHTVRIQKETEKPEEFEEPDEQDEPEEPEKEEESEKPDEPEEAAEPEKPEESAKPDESEKPKESGETT